MEKLFKLEQVDDGFKYYILAEFKKRQREQNRPIAGMLNQEAETIDSPVGKELETRGTSGKSYRNAVCKALAESKGTDWLLALIAFLLFCILISK